jgi:hypothetical protein
MAVNAAMPTDPAAAQAVRDNQQKVARVLAQAMADDGLRQRLTADATTVFAQNGVHIEGWRFQVVPHVQGDNVDLDKKLVSFEIPARPTAALSDAQLEGVAGGKSSCLNSASTISTGPSCVSSSSTASTRC